MFKDASHLDHIPEVKNRNVLQAHRELEQHNWSSEEKEAYLASKIDDDMGKSNLEHAKEEGVLIGEEREKEKMAKLALKKNIDLQTICDLTGLTIKQIKELEND